MVQLRQSWLLQRSPTWAGQEGAEHWEVGSRSRSHSRTKRSEFRFVDIQKRPFTGFVIHEVGRDDVSSLLARFWRAAHESSSPRLTCKYRIVPFKPVSRARRFVPDFQKDRSFFINFDDCIIFDGLDFSEKLAWAAFPSRSSQLCESQITAVPSRLPVRI